ncbi:hypothetical protein, partial [Priestia megaterium]|uniref:hypothetical protein n=1 Tax=Priestia megaterium TaxID=1404 RepID=UPI0035B5B3FB
MDCERYDWIKSELAAGRAVSAELPKNRKDGTPYDAEILITPLFDANGHRTNFVCSHHIALKLFAFTDVAVDA